MAKVLFKRYETDLEATESDIIDGQFIVTKEGTSYIDYGEERIPTNGTLDDEMSSYSMNGVQNKVIKEYVDNKITDDITSQGNVAPTAGTVKDYVDGKHGDTLLFSDNSPTGKYTHTLVLSENALKFRELVILTTTRDDNNYTYKAVSLPIYDNVIYSGGTVVSYHWLDINTRSYDSTTNTLTLSTAYWTNSGNNSNVAISKIIGRY